ncbi:MAG TPA: response regulator [Anaerohalosphaeraceae bacterium]|nr:response regulator [Anaerohalosphaeraceae bacterium]HRT49931.1 response regulator [Anaerohalosphaeraceae bacterium]HRT85771.1 response regulator [Anaerohalosphaeraceae bacterium]
MAGEKILVVEDEEDVLELVRYNLGKNGYKVETAMSGEEALQKAMRINPDLILLDLMLPTVDGLEVCRKVKNDPRTQHVPVVMLTAKGEEADIVTGLEMGADDYVTKPFSPRVLMARVKAVLRRPAERKETDVLVLGDLEIDPGRHRVAVKGESVDLTSTEFKLLHYLAQRAGWVFTRYQIVDAVHGSDYPVTDRSVDVQIVGLRKKLGSAGDYIETVRGVGYRFKEF